MPINPINFHNVDPVKGYVDQGSGIEDIFSNILKGYKTAKTPGIMEQQRVGRDLENEDQIFKNMLQRKYGEEEKKGDIEYKRAMSQRIGEKGLGGTRIGSPTNIGKLYNEREAAAKAYGEDSEQVKMYDAAIEKAAGTGVTNATRTKLQETVIADLGRRYLSKKEMPYIGAEADLELANDYAEYVGTSDKSKKEKLKKRLAYAAAAEKIAPEYAGYQLNSQGVRPTVHALRLQEKAIKRGWPRTLGPVINNLPKEVMEEANRIHAQFLEDINKTRGKKISDGFSAEPSEGDNKFSQALEQGGISDEDINFMAEKYGMTPEEVKQQLEGQ